jgi:hypothetical protein
VQSIPPFELYPNPAKNMLNIVSPLVTTFIMADLSGKQIYSGTLKTGINAIQTSSIPSGNYFISVFSNNQKTITQKVIIQH